MRKIKFNIRIRKPEAQYTHDVNSAALTELKEVEGYIVPEHPYTSAGITLVVHHYNGWSGASKFWTVSEFGTGTLMMPGACDTREQAIAYTIERLNDRHLTSEDFLKLMEDWINKFGLAN